MSETVDRELMILVERVVRPLPASLKRQKRIRDEFLAHLHYIYAEELARDGDTEGALVRTRRRFGDPVALSDELSRSDSRQDRWLRRLESCVMQRLGESIARYVLRLVLFQLALTTVILLVAPLRVGFAVILCMALSFGGMFFCSLQWGQEWERRRRWGWLAWQSLGLAISFPLGIYAMLLVAGGNPTELSPPVFSLAGMASLSLVIGPIIGVLHTRDMTYLREWASLELEPA